MDSSVLIVVEGEILPGKGGALKESISRLVAHAKATEPDLLFYNWYVDEAGTQLRIIERYANSEAVIFHSQNVASFSAELSQFRVIRKIAVHGSVNDQLRAGLGKAGAEMFDFVEGHSRSK